MFERGKKERSDMGGKDVSGVESRADANKWQSESAAPAKSAGQSEMAVIGRSIRIDGDLSGEEDLRIEGDVNGTIQLRNNTLTIGSKGKISANVYAKSVTVDGLMEGDVFGSERVTVRKNAEVNGNITAPRVSLEDGAKFKGSIEMDPAVVAKALGLKEGVASSQVSMDSPRKFASPSNGGKHMEKSAAARDKGGIKTESVS